MEINKNLVKKIKSTPKTPGVYIFKDSNEDVIYVGKAISLNARLRSYIDKGVLSKMQKTRKLVSESVSVDTFNTDTELEALVLESNLIKKYSPKYNISLKDDKNYKYIKIKKSNFKNPEIRSYTVSTARKKTQKASYYGPFPQSKKVNIVLRDLRRLIPYRNCTDNKYNRYSKEGKPCLYGHIGLCPAPCLGVTQTSTNNKNVEKIKRFLKGEYKTILKSIKHDMQSASKELNYELAADLRNKLSYYAYLSQKYRSSEELLQGVKNYNTNYRSLNRLISLTSMYFPDLKSEFATDKEMSEYYDNFRIEFYDISNTSSEIIVGSQITLVGGDFSKEQYRKYKIAQEGQDDYKAMYQMLQRRLNHLRDWGAPDLIVLDGGKGQLSTILPLTNQKNIPTIALAKKEEEIIINFDNKFHKLALPKNDLGLNLLIKGRNEVHRFGITFNKNLRSKRFLNK